MVPMTTIEHIGEEVLPSPRQSRRYVIALVVALVIAFVAAMLWPRPSHPMRVGAAVTFQTGGGRLDVALASVSAGAISVQIPVTMPDGDRLYALELRLTAGASGFTGDMASDAAVVDSWGQRYAPSVNQYANGPALPQIVKVDAHGTLEGWLVFTVPASAKITSMEFALGHSERWSLS
jgi:hypothetical protein